MGIFNSIKKSRRASSDIDEKIEYLNKELEKNGLREAMITTKMYVSAQPLENPVYNDFTSAVFNAKPLGYSGSDGEGLGGAYTGKVKASEHGLSVGVHDHILNLDGVANSPKHPTSGRRRYASTRTGMVNFSPTQPGKLQGNSSYPTGSVAWLWNPNANNSDGTSGNWYPLEFDTNQNKWGFWDTGFLGFSFLNTNLAQLELPGGGNVGPSVVSLFDSIGISQKGVIGTENTLVLQKNRIGDAGFLPINIDGLSTQGYRYLRGKAGRLRKRGSGFRTQRGQKLLPYDKGKGGTRKSRQEIRGDTVNKLRGEGDNVGANIFYTKDRIKELEGKESLTYREESELKDLEEYNDWISTFDAPENFVSVSDQQSNFDAAAEEQSNNIFNKMNSSSSTISTTLDEILDSPASSGLSETERKAISSFSKAIESGEEITPELFSNFESTPDVPTPPTPPKPTTETHNPPEEFTFPDGSKGTISTSKIDGGIGDIIQNDKGEVVERNGLSTDQNKKITQSEKLRNNIDLATSILTNGIVEHKPSDQAIEQFKSNLTPEDISKFQFNTERVGFSDGNLSVTYDENGKKIFNPNRDSSGNQGANSPDLSVEFSNLNNLAIAAHGKPNAQVVLPTDGSEGYAVLEKYAYHNTSTTNPFSKNFDATELPNWQTGILSGLVHLAANTPAGKALQAVSDLFSKITGSDSKLPDFLNDYGIHGMSHHEIKVPLSELPDDVLAEIKKNGNWDAYEAAQNDKNAAGKYPPPGQSGEHVTPDGGKVKYYNKGIRTSADGSKYMEVLSMPWVEPKEGGEGYYGSLYHPGSYTMKVPLGGAKLRFKGMGKEVYTPKPKPEPPPKPEPDDRKDYEKNRDRQRRFRNSYEPKGNVLSEAAKLGHFEPEVLNVDINDIRKGIMPEFPKDPPPKMVDGYSEKSKLAPKKDEGNPDPFIKITKKDLAKNHMLKDSEIKKFMDEIDSINKYIKENPSELIYAQQRYPKDDPRLAQLNWQMDQMLDAGKEYMDKTFPENKKLFKKIQKSIKKNIELTDPKSFKDVEIPKYEGVNLTDFKRRKEVVSRHFKKAVKIQKLFSNKKRRNNVKEQIEYKDNNLHEFMTTPNMYVSGDRVPNQDVINFLNLNHGGYGLGLSAADGRHYGQAGVGPVSGSTGVALAPPHPTTGVVRSARHITSGLGNSTPLRPGQTTTIGFSDNPPTRTMGSALWFYDPNYDSGAGQWYNLEWGVEQGAWGFWDTVKSGQFTGLYIFNTDLSQHPAGDISNKISGINFNNNGSLGEPQTTVLNKNDLGDPGFLPIDIPLSKQGFDYLKDKSQNIGEKIKDVWNDLKDAGVDFAQEVTEFLNEKGTEFTGAAKVYLDYIRGYLKDGVIDNTYLGQDYVDNAFTDAFINDNGTVTVGDTVIGSGGELQYDPKSGIVTIPFEYDFDTNEEQIMKDPDKYDPRNSVMTAVGMFSAWLLGGKYGLDSVPVPFAGYATWLSKLLGGGKPTTGHGITMPIEDVKEKNPNLYNYITQNKIGDNQSDSSSESDPRSENDPRSEENFESPSWFTFSSRTPDGRIFGYNYSGAFGELKPASSRGERGSMESGYGTKGYDFKTNSGGTAWTMDYDARPGDTSKGGASEPKPSDKKNKNNNNNNKNNNNDNKNNNNKNNNNDNKNNNNNDNKPIDPFGNEVKPNLGGKDGDKIAAEYPKKDVWDKMIDALDKGNFKYKPGDPNYVPKGRGMGDRWKAKNNKKKSVPMVAKYQPEGDILNESAKLGHFEPEMLNVDIEKLRQGIMPEFPKDPPPEMINGYSAKSRLAPKTIEGEPFLKITKKDLAKNHRLKDSEIKDFMKQIDAINKYIKENPAELKYVLIRYPKDDPRLAQLNWEMDQKLNASKQFMDKHYPENQKLFTKIKKSIKKNIELTDPKSFKGVKIPKFKGVDLTDYKRRKALVSRHFKKAIRKNNKKT